MKKEKTKTWKRCRAGSGAKVGRLTESPAERPNAREGGEKRTADEEIVRREEKKRRGCVSGENLVDILLRRAKGAVEVARVH